MVKFSCALEKECHSFKGGPWEMNLRDLTRWAESISNNPKDAGRFALLIYANRMRCEQDKQKVLFCFFLLFYLLLIFCLIYVN